MGRILWFIIVALFVFWLLGLAFKIGGGLIHYPLSYCRDYIRYPTFAGKRSSCNKRDAELYIISL